MATAACSGIRVSNICPVMEGEIPEGDLTVAQIS
jgi:hypothetical protein